MQATVKRIFYKITWVRFSPLNTYCTKWIKYEMLTKNPKQNKNKQTHKTKPKPKKVMAVHHISSKLNGKFVRKWASKILFLIQLWPGMRVTVITLAAKCRIQWSVSSHQVRQESVCTCPNTSQWWILVVKSPTDRSFPWKLQDNTVWGSSDQYV